MNISILYISGAMTSLLLVFFIVIGYGFGLRGKKFALSLICGSLLFLLIQYLPIPQMVENNISLLALNVEKSGIDQIEINRKINNVCADNIIRGYEYFELVDHLSNAIDLSVQNRGVFEYNLYKEYNQICR